MMKQHDVYDIIIHDIASGVLERFERKSRDYGESWRLLGAKGQFSDINRKFWKLYNSIWMDQELVGEQPDECVEDIIGHCLILLYILRREPTPERALFSSSPTDVGATLRTCGQGPSSVDLGEVVEAIRMAAKAESRDGSSLTRIIDAVASLYARRNIEMEGKE